MPAVGTHLRAVPVGLTQQRAAPAARHGALEQEAAAACALGFMGLLPLADPSNFHTPSLTQPVLPAAAAYAFAPRLPETADWPPLHCQLTSAITALPPHHHTIHNGLAGFAAQAEEDREGGSCLGPWTGQRRQDPHPQGAV